MPFGVRSKLGRDRACARILNEREVGITKADANGVGLG
jgi:hypothetical protein